MGDRSDNDNTQSFSSITVGTMVDHYRIADAIGTGGMGEVYLAEDTILKRFVALKVMPALTASHPDMKARFHREALAVAALSHPNIVTIYEVGEFQDRPYFAMEHVPGDTLRTIIRSARLSVGRAIDLARQICDGLQDAHSAGVIHRDLKPGNIMLDMKRRVRILDFGLARVAGEEKLTKSGSTMGTVGYMSPEQVEGRKVDHRSDLFSVGVILYEMLTGRRPFEGDSDAAVIRAIATTTPEPLARYKADIPDEIQHIIDKALDKSVDTRYQHADEMRADLERALAGVDFSSGRVRLAGRSRIGVSLSIAATVVVVALMLWWPWSGRDGQEPTQQHLAVLPFANLGGVASTQLICEALTEILSSKLTQMERFQGSLYVVPASDVREYEVTSARGARDTFGVTHVVTGSCQQTGDDVRMTLNLVDARTERQLRSKVVDESLASLNSLQDSLVLVLSHMLDVQLQTSERRTLSAGETDSPTAYDYYLLARGYLRLFDYYADAANLDSASRLLSQALVEDPDYALAQAALGETYWRRYQLDKNTDWVAPAEHYTRQAAELANDLAPVQISLGLIYRGTGKFDEAAACFQRALEIDSTSYPAHRELALTLRRLGQTDRAEQVFREAIALRPYRWGGYFDLARFYLYQGQVEDALRRLQEAEARAPEAVAPLNDLGGLYLMLGNYERANELFQQSAAIGPSYASFSNLGTIAGMKGQPGEAARWYEKALDIDDSDFQVWMNVAAAYEALPDGTDKAQASFRRAIELGEAERKVRPNDAWTISLLADCYLSTGRIDRALVMAEEAVALDSGNVEIVVRAGLVFEEAGERDKALDLVTRAVRQGFLRSRIEEVPEFAGLLADPRFDSLVAGEQ